MGWLSKHDWISYFLRDLMGNRDSETMKIEERADVRKKSHPFCKAQIRLQKTESEP
jgi:hypothetical protein